MLHKNNKDSNFDWDGPMQYLATGHNCDSNTSSPNSIYTKELKCDDQ